MCCTNQQIQFHRVRLAPTRRGVVESWVERYLEYILFADRPKGRRSPVRYIQRFSSRKDKDMSLTPEDSSRDAEGLPQQMFNVWVRLRVRDTRSARSAHHYRGTNDTRKKRVICHIRPRSRLAVSNNTRHRRKYGAYAKCARVKNHTFSLPYPR